MTSLVCWIASPRTSRVRTSAASAGANSICCVSCYHRTLRHARQLVNTYAGDPPEREALERH
jgi:hypothetical protein